MPVAIVTRVPNPDCQEQFGEVIGVSSGHAAQRENLLATAGAGNR